MASLTAGQKIRSVPIESEMRRSYIKYAMSVIVGRALPDVRDGLKPVHRRILYAMYSMGLDARSAHKKAARVVGEVLGKFHPHGDTAVYDALVRMAQDFSMRYPLIGGQGNFGSVDGDEPAAMRYTEVRLAKISDFLLQDIEKETVGFTPNFDDTLEEPAVLPSLLPNLMVNGSSGIAVGMSCNIPPHNLREVVSAITHLIDSPDSSVKDLLQYIEGPDFPTAGIVYDGDNLTHAYETGRGILTITSKIVEEERAGGKKRLIIKEIPFQVAKSKVVEDIADLVRAGKIEGIASLRDESGREGIEIVIDLKQTAVPALVKNQLLKHTQLQQSFSFINLVLLDGQPRILNLKETLQAYIDHRVNIVERRSKFDLRKAEERAHILEGYLIALSKIEEIIKTIRGVETADDARKALASYKLSEKQIDAILQMRLQQLTRLEKNKISTELEEKRKQIDALRSLLADRRKILATIKDELNNFAREYADDRRTRVMERPAELTYEESIPDQEILVLLSKEGYIKRLRAESFGLQQRGGKGITAAEVKERDLMILVLYGNARDELLCVSSHGRAFRLRAFDVPEMGRPSRGTPLVNLLPLDEGEQITYIMRSVGDQTGFLTLLTSRGVVKKSDLELFRDLRSTGVIAINLDEGDYVAGGVVTSGNDELMICTQNGYAIRFDEGEVPVVSRAARGVMGIDLEPGDKAITLLGIKEGAKGDILSISSPGHCKRTPLDAYKPQGRAGKGLISMSVNEKVGSVAYADAVSAGDGILVVTAKGQAIKVPAAGLPTYSRASQGVRIIRLDEGDSVARGTKLP